MENDENLNSIISVIKSIAPLTEKDIELLIPIIQTISVKKSSYILKEGEVSRNVYFLISGFFRMFYVDIEGVEINYRFADNKNFIVDFQSFLTEKPSHFYWQAMEDSQLLVLSYQSIQKVYSISPAWNNFGRLLAEHVYLQLNERVELLLFMTPEERYLYLQKSQPQLISKVSQFHLASYLGIKPESLSRIRKRLSKK
ncbi:MAG: Crp/Fnr family transcriptional regulator [Saprospiraceae bacterium]